MHRIQRSKTLTVLFVVVVLGGAIFARRSAAHNDSQNTRNQAFVMRMANGRAACRGATAAEARASLPGANNRGVPIGQVAGEQRPLAPSEIAPNALTIQLNALSQLQTDSNRNTVIAAFQRAAATWSARIKSPITITINIDYGFNMPDGTPFDDGVVGSTSSGSVTMDYATARANLIATAANQGESAIYNSLPVSSVPVNAGIGSAVEVSRSIGQALGFVPLDPATAIATISFNKDFPFDFNPDNGINSSSLDFVGTATHEIGHALGFISNAGGGSGVPLTSWDLFRLRSGTTPNTFPTAQRIMTTGGTQVYYTTQSFFLNSNTTELRLSTGGPDGDAGDGNQSSHWKDDDITGQYIGVMDPTIDLGERMVTTENDFSALETFGWNLVGSAAPPVPLPADDNDNFDGARVLVGCVGSVTGKNVNATKEAGEPNHAPDNNGGTHSVWYQWQAPSSGSVTITTAGSAYDTVLAVYTGAGVNGLLLITRNDDIPDVFGQPHQVTSAVTISAVAGATYRIAVDGYNNGGDGGDMGPLKLNWTQSGCTEPSRILLLEEGVNRIAALDSVTFVRGPFRVTDNFNFSADHRTRVMFLLYGLGLTTADISAVTVSATGINLPVESVGPFTAPGLSATYVIVRLPDNFPAGDWPLNVTVRGAANASNPILSISGP